MLKKINLAIFFAFITVFILMGAASMNVGVDSNSGIIKHAWALWYTTPLDKRPEKDTGARWDAQPVVPEPSNMPSEGGLGTFNSPANPNPSADTSCQDGDVFKVFGAKACHAFETCMQYGYHWQYGNIDAQYQHARTGCLRGVAIDYPDQGCLKQYNNEKYCEELQFYKLDVIDFNNCAQTHTHGDLVNGVCGNPQAPVAPTPVAATNTTASNTGSGTTCPTITKHCPPTYTPISGACVNDPHAAGCTYCTSSNASSCCTMRTDNKCHATTTSNTGSGATNPECPKYLPYESINCDLSDVFCPDQPAWACTEKPTTPTTSVSLFDLIFGTGGQQPLNFGAWLRDIIEASVGYALQQHGIVVRGGEGGGMAAAGNNDSTSFSFDMPGIFSERNISINTNTNSNGAGITTTTATTAGGGERELLDSLNVGADLTDSYATNIMRHVDNMAKGDMKNVNDDVAKSCDISTTAAFTPIVVPVCGGGSVAAAVAPPGLDSNNNDIFGLKGLSRMSDIINNNDLLSQPVKAQSIPPATASAVKLPGSEIECFSFKASCTTPDQTPAGVALGSQSSQCAFPPCGIAVPSSNSNNASGLSSSSALQRQDIQHLQTNLGNQIAGALDSQQLQQKLPSQDSIRQQVQQQLQQHVPQVNIFSGIGGPGQGPACNCGAPPPGGGGVAGGPRQ